MVTILLPMPPSINRLWRNGRGKTYISPEYKTWKDEALVCYLQQKKDAGIPVTGAFTYHVVLDEKSRGRSDGDNRSSKAILDFLQSVGLIENDRFADAGSWSWGPCDPGFCMVRVFSRGKYD